MKNGFESFGIVVVVGVVVVAVVVVDAIVMNASPIAVAVVIFKTSLEALTFGSSTGETIGAALIACAL